MGAACIHLKPACWLDPSLCLCVFHLSSPAELKSALSDFVERETTLDYDREAEQALQRLTMGDVDVNQLTDAWARSYVEVKHMSGFWSMLINVHIFTRYNSKLGGKKVKGALMSQQDLMCVHLYPCCNSTWSFPINILRFCQLLLRGKFSLKFVVIFLLPWFMWASPHNIRGSKKETLWRNRKDLHLG